MASLDDVRNSFWTADPPRVVPWTVALRMVLGGWTQVALAALLVTTPFFWVFTMEGRLSPAALIALLPAGAAVVVALMLYRGLGRLQVLRHGLCAEAWLRRKRKTRISQGNRQMWALEFQFSDREGDNHQIAKTVSHADNFVESRAYPVLYDPQAPGRVLLQPFVKYLRSSARPEVLQHDYFLALLCLIIPVAIAVVNAKAFWLWLRGSAL